ncbi:MAG TPA: amino acid permease [Minicystis sp.]|nr:amino acid permease [Minicystis sp.]
MSFATVVFGQRLASDEEEQERVGTLSGVPTFGLDALSSAAYGPEAALTVLAAAGAVGLSALVPISAVVLGVLWLVSLSYRQTIWAYPRGGGSYTVAKENLGRRASLVAAAALLVDYVLNVAVAVSAGVGALVSAHPALLGDTLPLCLAFVAVLTLVNLRGARSTGLAFALPTVAFLACLFVVIGLGVARTIAAGGHPTPSSPRRRCRRPSSRSASGSWRAPSRAAAPP